MVAATPPRGLLFKPLRLSSVQVLCRFCYTLHLSVPLFPSWPSVQISSYFFCPSTLPPFVALFIFPSLCFLRDLLFKPLRISSVRVLCRLLLHSLFFRPFASFVTFCFKPLRISSVRVLCRLLLHSLFFRPFVSFVTFCSNLFVFLLSEYFAAFCCTLHFSVPLFPLRPSVQSALLSSVRSGSFPSGLTNFLASSRSSDYKKAPHEWKLQHGSGRDAFSGRRGPLSCRLVHVRSQNKRPAGVPVLDPRSAVSRSKRDVGTFDPRCPRLGR